MKPLIRVGVEGGRKAVLQACRDFHAPLLLSANSLWNDKTKRFGRFKAYAGFDVALDSGGFVALKRYGGYRYNPQDYAQLAATLKPTWWAQMDFCCEPELATSPSQVFERIDLTVQHLHACQAAAKSAGCAPPMPVLQGWTPSDYTSGPAFDPSFVWPSLVGVGSVCRRPIAGPTGVLAIVAALHAKLPPHVKLHLFGVKSGTLGALLERYPNRIASVDSMAWSSAARWDANHGLCDRSSSSRAASLRSWYPKQLAQLNPPQLPLPL